MAVNGRSKLVSAIFAGALAFAGCGGDSDGDGNGNNTGGDNNGTGNNGGTGNNNGNSTGNTGDAGGPTTDLDDNVAGQACNSNADCKGTGATCATEIGGITFGGMSIGGRPAPDGYCTGACTANEQCGKGGVCVGAIAGILEGSCQQACDTDGDCRDGHECNEGQTIDADAGIPGGGVTIPNTCLPKPETVQIEDGKVGIACTADADCGGGVCSTRLGIFTTAPGGYCSGPCTTNEDCGQGGVCTGTNPLTGAGACYLGCASNTECTRDGYICRTVPLSGSDLEVCYPGMVAGDAGM
jgi:hypothetical protein